jgi:hypothetical protein
VGNASETTPRSKYQHETSGECDYLIAVARIFDLLHRPRPKNTGGGQSLPRTTIRGPCQPELVDL